MPTYEYRCSSCKHQEDVFQKITADPLSQCPKCSNGTFMRGPGGGIGLIFKGSGFYKTEYAATPEPSEGNSLSADSSSGSGCCPCGKGKESCSSR